MSRKTVLFTVKTSSSKMGTATKWLCVFRKISKGFWTCADTNTRKIARTYVRKIGPRQQRIRKIGPRNGQRRRQQAGAGLNLSTTLDLGRKAAESKLSKMMINDAIDYIPTAYKKIKNKITNKKVKAVMNTGVDDYLVNRGVELIGERFDG